MLVRSYYDGRKILRENSRNPQLILRISGSIKIPLCLTHHSNQYLLTIHNTQNLPPVITPS